MIHYIKHKNINRIKWDALIEKSLNSNCYAYSWYLDVIGEGWDILVEDDYLSGMPVCVDRKYTLKYILAPMFAQQLGIFSIHRIDQKLINDFVRQLPTAVYIDANLNYANDFSFEGFTQTYKSNYELNLNKSYPELRKDISENTRRNIKKAKNANLIIERNTDIDTVIDLFKKNKGEIYKHIKKKNYQVLKTLIGKLIERQSLEIWYVKDTFGNIFVGGFFILLQNRIVFLFSGRTEEAKNNGAVFFLFNELISAYAGKDIILDFAGSNDPGVARLYKSFGAEEKKYLRIVKNRLPFFIKWLKK